MDTATGSTSTYREDTARVSSGAWVMNLIREIGQPDQPHPSVFDDSDVEDMNRQSSDESRISTLAQVAACVSAAGAADAQRDRLSSMASAYSLAGQFSSVDMDREQSWEFPYRESSLLAARTSVAVVLPDAMVPTSSTTAAAAAAAAVTDEEMASRKRKSASCKSVNRRKRALVEPSPQRAPSPEVEDVDADVIDVREDDIRDDDILGGRGGLSNHHVGNKRFRKIVADMKEMYRETGVKTDKTALSRAIVAYVHSKGGRFLIKKANGKGWRVITIAKSRKKTSQALREPKELKWTLSASASATQETTREI